MEFKKIEFSHANGIATVRLNSPGNLNAIDAAMAGELMAAFDVCADDGAIKVVVVEGAGDSFSAGGDIKMMIGAVKANNMAALISGVRNVGAVAVKIRNLRKPVIACVHGAVAGAGVNFALACDFRVAAENTKFIQAFVNIGLVPDMGGTFLLTRLIGVARTTELVMTGKPLAVAEAFNMGLVNQVVPAEQLREAAEKLARQLCRLPSVALGNMKALINRAAFGGLENALDNETEYQTMCAGTEDFKEGIMAFAEKRKPVFKGK